MIYMDCFNRLANIQSGYDGEECKCYLKAWRLGGE